MGIAEPDIGECRAHTGNAGDARIIGMGMQGSADQIHKTYRICRKSIYGICRVRIPLRKNARTQAGAFPSRSFPVRTMRTAQPHACGRTEGEGAGSTKGITMTMPYGWPDRPREGLFPHFLPLPKGIRRDRHKRHGRHGFLLLPVRTMQDRPRKRHHHTDAAQVPGQDLQLFPAPSHRDNAG